MILRRAALLEEGMRVRFPDGSILTVDGGPFHKGDRIGFDFYQEGKVTDTLRTMSGEVIETRGPPKPIIGLTFNPDDLMELFFEI